MSITAQLFAAAADTDDPMRAVGFVSARIICIGLAVWGITRLIQKACHPRTPQQPPQR